MHLPLLQFPLVCIHEKIRGHDLVKCVAGKLVLVGLLLLLLLLLGSRQVRYGHIRMS